MVHPREGNYKQGNELTPYTIENKKGPNLEGDREVNPRRPLKQVRSNTKGFGIEKLTLVPTNPITSMRWRATQGQEPVKALVRAILPRDLVTTKRSIHYLIIILARRRIYIRCVVATFVESMNMRKGTMTVMVRSRVIRDVVGMCVTMLNNFGASI
ncbi:hypothetical protein CR513_55901, partial [Mucuna pruriens]